MCVGLKHHAIGRVIKMAMQILDRNAGKINEYVECRNGRLINKLDVDSEINGGPISNVRPKDDLQSLMYGHCSIRRST